MARGYERVDRKLGGELEENGGGLLNEEKTGRV